MLLHLPQNSFANLLLFSGGRLTNLSFSFPLLIDEKLLLLLFFFSFLKITGSN